MFTSEIIYLGNLRTEAIHLRSGNTMIIDAPLDNMGKGDGFFELAAPDARCPMPFECAVVMYV